MRACVYVDEAVVMVVVGLFTNPLGSRRVRDGVGS